MPRLFALWLICLYRHGVVAMDENRCRAGLGL